MPKPAFFKLSDEKQLEITCKIENIFMEYSYNISLVDFLDKLEMQPGTFYRYFADKDDAFLHMAAVSSERSELTEDSLLHPSYEVLTDENLTVYTIKRRKMFQSAPEAVLRRFYFGSNKNRITAVYLKALKRMKYNGMINDDADPELLAYMYATTLYNFEMYVRENGLSDDYDLIWKMKRYFYYSFFMNGIMKSNETE